MAALKAIRDGRFVQGRAHLLVYLTRHPEDIGAARQLGETLARLLPRDVSDGEVFTVDPTLASVDDVQFTMTGPSATATMPIGFKASANISIGSGGSILNVNPAFHTGITLPAGVTKEIPQIPGACVTVQDPTAFTAVASASAAGALPSLTASGVGNSFLSDTLDLVGFAVAHTPWTFTAGADSKGASWTGQALTVSGAISGTGGVTQFSSGGLILSGAKTYTGRTNVFEGALTLEGAATSLAGDVALLGGSLAIDADESLGSLSGFGTSL